MSKIFKRKTIPKIEIEKVFLSERDIEEMGIRSAAALRNDRWKGLNLLPYYKIGKNIRYRKEDVLKLIEQTRVEASGQSGSENK